MRNIQKVVLKVIDAFLAVMGLVFFLIYALTLLALFPVFILMDFEEFLKNPLGFIKITLIEMKELLEGE